jgi:hypothetical protein
MEHKKRSKTDADLLSRYSDFSKMVTEHHHLENLSEFVLHDVCAPDLFDLSKAAYLVSNPDFSCMKGVAGYHREGFFPGGHSWKNLKGFTAHMKESDFNQQVRALYDQDLRQNSEQKQIQELADRLDIKDPLYHVWPLKHANQGVLIFDSDIDDQMHKDHLIKFLYMLSFCPVF